MKSKNKQKATKNQTAAAATAATTDQFALLILNFTHLSLSLPSTLVHIMRWHSSSATAHFTALHWPREWLIFPHFTAEKCGEY